MSAPPDLADNLPELDGFVDELAADVASGLIADNETFVQRCRRFYTDDAMARIERVVTGWSTMAAHLDGVTLWHTTAALMSLRTLREYEQAAAGPRALMNWAVLLHDLDKRPGGTGRDHRHAFRSAAAAGRVLPRIGFEVTGEWSDGFEAWSSLTEAACRFDPRREEYVQDNDRLAAIIGGAERLYGPEALVVLKAIVLHLSVTVVTDWPARTPLTNEQEQNFIDRRSRPVLLATMLADHGGWNSFEPELLKSYLRQTRRAFNRL